MPRAFFFQQKLILFIACTQNPALVKLDFQLQFGKIKIPRFLKSLIMSQKLKAKAEQLAKQFDREALWIFIGLRACELVGIPDSYFVDYYLHKMDLPIREDVSTAMQQLWLSEAHTDFYTHN